MNRRKFVELAAFTSPLLAFKKSDWPSPNPFSPIVVATWDSGQPVAAEAWKVLMNKGSALDAIEAGARLSEATPSCCVGLDGYPDRDGTVTLDACIMDEKGNCGAVAALEQIKHPISVARKVMETTPHVLLAGAGAQQFALENGFQKEPKTLSDDAKKAWKDWLKKSDYHPEINIENKKPGGPFAPAVFEDGGFNHDTMGLVAMDGLGNCSGGVTTSGMAFKLHGRVGDSPIIGAGLFVDNEVGAATSSGVGEEVIRICGTHLVVEFMRQGMNPTAACKKAIERIVNRNPAKAKTLQVGFLAINKKGQHGAFAINPGFVYALKNSNEERLVKSDSWFK